MSGNTRFSSSLILSLVKLTIFSVSCLISCMNEARSRRPCSISFSLNSHSPVISGELNDSIPISSSSSINASPLLETTRSRFCCSCLNKYLWEMSPSMIAARVAGVPSPLSLIASRSASSSTRLPAVSIAERRVASVYRAGGFVSSSMTSSDKTLAVSPVSVATSSPLPDAIPGLWP